jgi:hypothetical protein
MLSFFRKTRKKVFGEGTLPKYLLYAIGEILLVMIGILLALQVNNWNENRRAKIIERNALIELLVEFENNKVQFDTVYSKHLEAKRGCLRLQALSEMGYHESDAESWNAALHDFRKVWTFNPSSSIAHSLITTANYEKVQNDSLRILLVGWSDLIEDFQEEEIWARHVMVNLINPFFSKTLPSEITSADTYPMWVLGRQEFDGTVLSSMEFRNHLALRYTDIMNIESEAYHVRWSMETIIRLIKEELHGAEISHQDDRQ